MTSTFTSPGNLYVTCRSCGQVFPYGSGHSCNGLFPQTQIQAQQGIPAVAESKIPELLVDIERLLEKLQKLIDKL